jgi:hypothetical protein
MRRLISIDSGRTPDRVRCDARGLPNNLPYPREGMSTGSQVTG